MNEYEGGTITQNKCTGCGKFVKVPNEYKPYFNGLDFVGCFAKTYCKKCKSDVLLLVEFI